MDAYTPFMVLTQHEASQVKRRSIDVRDASLSFRIERYIAGEDRIGVRLALGDTQIRQRLLAEVAVDEFRLFAHQCGLTEAARLRVARNDRPYGTDQRLPVLQRRKDKL